MADEQHDDDLILDLRDLVKPRRRVRTSVGDFGLMGIEQLDAISRTEIAESLHAAQRQATEIIGMEIGTSEYRAAAEALGETEDEVLRVALTDSTREQRDQLAPPERAAILAAFYGAADEAALTMASQLRRVMAEHTPPDAPTGARSSRSSKRRTAATRSAG